MNQELIKTILEGIFTVLGIIFSSKWFYEMFKWMKGNGKNDKKIDSNENLMVSFQQIGELNTTVSDMFAKSSADRFLLLLADIDNPKHNWVSAIYEQHKSSKGSSSSVGATNRYVKLIVDQEYKDMITEAKLKGVKKYTTECMPDCLLKNIYIYEKVTHSNIYYVMEFKESGFNLTLFISIAKHGEEEFSIEDDVLFKITVSKITNDILSGIVKQKK